VADVPLKDWALNFTDLLTAAPATYGLSAGNATACATAFGLYEAALTLATNPATRTAVTIADKNVQKANMRAVIFPFATTIAGNPAVADPDKVDIGVTVRITTRTRVAFGLIGLMLSMDAVSATGVTLRRQNPATPDSTAGPYGNRGWQISVRVRNALNTADEFTDSFTASRRFYTYPTDPGWVGRLAFYKARWVGPLLPGEAPNNGPWSAEVSTILP
jgi:hypothetical protein